MSFVKKKPDIYGLSLKENFEIASEANVNVN